VHSTRRIEDFVEVVVGLSLLRFVLVVALSFLFGDLEDDLATAVAEAV